MLIKILLANGASSPRHLAPWPRWRWLHKTWSLLKTLLQSLVLCYKAASLLLQGKFEDDGVAHVCVRSLWAADSPFPGVGHRKRPDGSKSHFESATTFISSLPSFKLLKKKICCGGNPFSKSQGDLPDYPVFLCSDFMPQHSGQLDQEGVNALQVSETPPKPVCPHGLSSISFGKVLPDLLGQGLWFWKRKHYLSHNTDIKYKQGSCSSWHESFL